MVVGQKADANVVDGVGGHVLVNFPAGIGARAAVLL